MIPHSWAARGSKRSEPGRPGGAQPAGPAGGRESAEHGGVWRTPSPRLAVSLSPPNPCSGGGGIPMFHPLRFRLFTSCIVACAAAFCFFVPVGPAGPAEKPSPSRSVYHADPEHLWNRLYEALFVRVGP